MRTSDLILERCEDALAAMLSHRFVEDVCADRLPTPVLHRYLVQEGLFVETAIEIVALGTARAPDIMTRRHLIAVQDALANVQVPYFEARFARLGLAPPATLPERARGLGEGALAIAWSGDFLDIAAALFAAEWMYEQWCARAAETPSADPDLREWVALHVDDAFRSQVRWLADAIDAHAGRDDVDRLAAIVERVTRLEIEFHHAPYDDPAPGTAA